ncbi:MAG: type 1 glutamine amidotransferase [Mycobacterium sp.]|nr:type 1 glutamine amidotransferase [Mycobacterium sp.]
MRKTESVSRRVLFVYNDPSAPEALLGEVFTESGFQITTFEVVPPHRIDDPRVEVTFPDPTRYDVIVPLGSRWPVYDETLPWVASEIAMVHNALDAGVGVLGVCFGGQLLATALGGSVTRSLHPEVGWHEVRSDTPDLVPGGPWFQWHFDRFTPPPNARLVARNDRAAQAFTHGRALGLQFHPEVDEALVQRWIAEDSDGDMVRLGLDPDELQRRTGAEIDGAVERLRTLVSGFLGLLEDGRDDPHRLR